MLPYKFMMSFLLSVILTPMVLYASSTPQFLTKDNYIKQVLENNSAAKYSLKKIESNTMKKSEGDLLFRPNLLAQTRYFSDEKETTSPLLSGTKSTIDSYLVSVSNQFEMGLLSKVTYNINHTSLAGARSIADPNFFENKLALELSFPLWRNFAATEFKLRRDIMSKKSEAIEYGEKFKLKRLILDAEVAYLRLSTLRESIKIYQESLNKAEKLYSWSKGRYDKLLTDKSDLLQAEANIQVKTMDLQNAILEEKVLCRQFNQLRNSELESVQEQLAMTNDESLLKGDQFKISDLNINENREDLKSEYFQQLIEESNASLEVENKTPSLELFGQVALNGKDSAFGDTFAESFTTKYPTMEVGVKFVIPLDQELNNKVKQGYAQDRMIAKIGHEKKIFDVNREWNDLVKKLSESKERLQLASNLEKIQSQKVEQERKQLQIGRTTTFQVLNFEQDHVMAKLKHTGIKGEMLLIMAQMNLFKKWNY